MKIGQKQLCSGFIYSAIAILVVLSLAKLIESGSNAKILDVYDPVFVIKNRYILWLAGGLEMIIVLVCISGSKRQIQALAIAWLATNFVLYRLSLWLVGRGAHCLCLGSMAEGLHISPEAATAVTNIIDAYLLLGSYATLFWLWRQRKIVSAPAPAW